MVVKRYSNRRLYDTEESRYVTLDEVAARIRGGEDIRFVDAPSGEDVTQSFLAQIILESRGAARLMPVPLLYRMVRMGDDALAEFFGRYVTWALDVYLKMKHGARTMAAANPLAAVPLAATDALMRWVGSWGQGAGATPPPSGPWAPPGYGGGYQGQGPGPGYQAPPPGGWPPGWAPPEGVARGEAFPPPPTPEGPPDGPWMSPEDTRQDGELAALRAELEGLKRVIREAMGPREGG